MIIQSFVPRHKQKMLWFNFNVEDPKLIDVRTMFRQYFDISFTSMSDFTVFFAKKGLLYMYSPYKAPTYPIKAVYKMPFPVDKMTQIFDS